MSKTIIANLEKLVDSPRDGALLRYSLGNEWLKLGEFAHAAAAYRQAVSFDPNYSAAWKGLGKALSESGDARAAIAAYNQGITVAAARGDVQASREMTVFAKRLGRTLETSENTP